MNDDGDETLEHLCSVCGKRASFGFGVSLRNGVLGTWYCKDHAAVINGIHWSENPPSTIVGQ